MLSEHALQCKEEIVTFMFTVARKAGNAECHLYVDSQSNSTAMSKA